MSNERNRGGNSVGGLRTGQPTGSDQHRNDEMNLAWQFIVNTGISVFLTGKAGTGKTTFLKRLRDMMPKRMVVLAPTGVAAINAGGQTIHSFFQFPFGPYVPGTSSDSRQMYKMSETKKRMIRTLDLIVIDEISMVRADLLDQIDDVMRRYRDASKPFGGAQLLMIGDLMQLSPIAKPEEWNLLSAHYNSPYFFASKALSSLPYITIELKHIYRQSDEAFVKLLGKVRNGNLNDADVRLLNTRYVPGFRASGPGWIHLTTHNHTAHDFNEARLNSLPSREVTLEAKVTGEFPEMSYPTDRYLRLKEGAQVMFVKNDPTGSHAYYNGKIGIVKAIKASGITVECDNGQEEIEVLPIQWENTKYSIDEATKAIKEEVAGTFSQYPLRLAWAITVHKSQGLTFDRAVLDVNASFAHGQVYVALSRCRTLEGMVLTNPIDPRSVITDMSVNSYIDSELARAEENAGKLSSMKREYLLSLLDELYSFGNLMRDLQWATRVVDEHLSRQLPELLDTLKRSEEILSTQVILFGERFRQQYPQSIPEGAESISGTPLSQRIKDSAKYFKEKLEDILKEVFSRISVNIKNKRVAEMYNNAFLALRSSLTSRIAIFNELTTSEFSTSNYLNIKAKAYLNTTSPSRKSAPRRNTPTAGAACEPRKPKVPKPNTFDETFKMLSQGLTPEEIAEKRNCTVNTIYSHIARFVEDGRCKMEDYISVDTYTKVANAVATFTEAYTLNALYEKLNREVEYYQIHVALAALAKSKK